MADTETASQAQRKAPWPDYTGNVIYAGDVIEHPDGSRGTVVYRAAEEEIHRQWRVDYGDGDMLSLGLQIGNKGQAVVVRRSTDE